MKIRPVKHEGMFPKNRYCGPAAISIISGISTGEAAKLLRVITGARAIRGVWTWDLEMALQDLGYDLLPYHSPRHDSVPRRERPTLARWLKGTKTSRTSGRVFLIIAGNHFQVVSGRRYCCARTGKIVSIRDSMVKRRARVFEAYEVVKCDPTPNDFNNWNDIKRGYA